MNYSIAFNSPKSCDHTESSIVAEPIGEFGQGYGVGVWTAHTPNPINPQFSLLPFFTVLAWHGFRRRRGDLL